MLIDPSLLLSIYPAIYVFKSTDFIWMATDYILAIFSYNSIQPFIITNVLNKDHGKKDITDLVGLRPHDPRIHPSCSLSLSYITIWSCIVMSTKQKKVKNAFVTQRCMWWLNFRNSGCWSELNLYLQLCWNSVYIHEGCPSTHSHIPGTYMHVN